MCIYVYGLGDGKIQLDDVYTSGVVKDLGDDEKEIYMCG